MTIADTTVEQTAATGFASIELDFDTTDTQTPIVTLWGKPGCVQCNATETDLNRKGIPFEKKDLTEHLDQLDAFKSRGYMQAPIVEFEDLIWTGFRPDMHETIVARLAG